MENTKRKETDIQTTYSDFLENMEVPKPETPKEKKKRRKHNYTSELELKSLLIRIKNDRQDYGELSEVKNSKINKYIRWHTNINAQKYQYPAKKNKLKNKLKERIIELSEDVRINKESYERFGQIILLMVKNILTKPQFSGYTYKDDFYSDAVFKILKYLHNFDHTKTSKITGRAVDAFAYISQIIHNSILYILNKKKKEQEILNRQIDMTHLNHNLELKYKTYYNEVSQDSYDFEDMEIQEKIQLKKVDTNLIDVIKKLEPEIERVEKLEIIYPSDYRISFEEYNELKELLRGKISITRAED